MSTTSRATTVATHPLHHPVRLARGIWLPGEAEDETARVRRFAEALPPHSVLVGRDAAMARGYWLPPQDGARRREFASNVPGRRGCDMNRTRRPELHGSRRQFRSDEVVEEDGIRMTSPARTWLDLAARLSLVELVALGDSILRSGTSTAELTAMINRNTRRRGVVNARLALPLLDPRSRSRPETHLRVELLAPGWPTFEVNQAIRDQDGGWLAEPDLSNEQFHVAVEYQSSWHTQDTRMRKDLTRGVNVVGNLWLSLPVGAPDVFGHPDRIRTAVAVLLRRGGWPGPVLSGREPSRVRQSA